ncbi:lipid asymmetry maintenance protein MlaB [Limnohabitans sp. 2KL-3]|uniref:STAS domain-containing protein n=1 Tax=Limnohabitans sp. 2KL-3 TaxID=1100700 RepID=UPI000B1A34F1|nr:STAS domain-containing protein [Limnohabitans sp. 2KL-3]
MSVLTMPETLLHEHAPACLALWVAQCKPMGPSVVSVDASALTAFDSSALAALLGLRREVLAQGGTLQISGMTSRLRELARLYGVIDLLEPV